MDHLPTAESSSASAGLGKRKSDDFVVEPQHETKRVARDQVAEIQEAVQAEKQARMSQAVNKMAAPKPLAVEDLDGLTVQRLKTELRDAGLSDAGNKRTLVDRLKAHLTTQDGSADAADEADSLSTGANAERAKWSKMTCPQLREQLKKAGLDEAGKKNELVDRLVDHYTADVQGSAASVGGDAAPPSEAHVADEIDESAPEEATILEEVASAKPSEEMAPVAADGRAEMDCEPVLEAEPELQAAEPTEDVAMDTEVVEPELEAEPDLKPEPESVETESEPVAQDAEAAAEPQGEPQDEPQEDPINAAEPEPELEAADTVAVADRKSVV